MKKILLFICFIFCSSSIAAENPPPKLIVQIVIDQLRGDLLEQYKKDFGTEGFNYLLNHAINYQSAHHPHALTVTCVGHATIATGSTPSLHGIIANDWYDPLTKKMVYCTEDAKNPILLTPRTKINDPIGQSPKNLLASTFSDELVLAQKGRAFGVSLKNRSAITLAGHAGKAFWFDSKNGGFVTSKFYYSKYPEWVNSWNSNYHPKNLSWELMSPLNTYRYAKVEPAKRNFEGFNDSFPHNLGKEGDENYYKYLYMSPYADEITADFALSLLKNEKLGKDNNKTDYLAISFSAVDIIGHQFGLNSIEAEDNLRHLDMTIAKVLKDIDSEVGLKNTLIILTADHGMEDSRNWLKENNLHGQSRLNMEYLMKIMTNLLQNQFNLPPEAIEKVNPPYVYLNHQLILEKKKSITQITTALAEMLRREPDLFTAFPLPLINNTNDWLSKKVAKMDFPGRSGDLFLVPIPYADLTYSNEVAFTHGSPWNYDSYVPLLFVNPNFKPTRITRLAYTTDIAPTLTSLMVIKPPSSAVGKPLQEVTRFYD